MNTVKGEDDLQLNDKESNAIKSSEIAYTKSLCGELSARPKTLGGQEKPTKKKPATERGELCRKPG